LCLFTNMPEFIEKYYSLAELWKNLPALPAARKYLAGGTDLVVADTCGGENSECWVDISDVKELRVVKETRDSVFIGAGLKISELAENRAVKKWIPSLAACAPYYASPTIRNTATLGGNLANASPCADGVCALAAAGAFVLLNFRGKRRKFPVLAILNGPKKIDLKKDELIEGFLVPKWKHRAVFLKMMPRKLFGIAKASLCLCYSGEEGVLKELDMALASVGPVIIRPLKTISLLKGKKLEADLVKKAVELVKTEISPITDLRSEADYRKEIVSVFLERALKEVKSK